MAVEGRDAAAEVTFFLYIEVIHRLVFNKFDVKGMRILCRSHLKLSKLNLINENVGGYGLCRCLSECEFPLTLLNLLCMS